MQTVLDTKGDILKNIGTKQLMVAIDLHSKEEKKILWKSMTTGNRIKKLEGE